MCGHSLGGATASVLMLTQCMQPLRPPLNARVLEKVRCITFGSPRIGNKYLDELITVKSPAWEQSKSRLHSCRLLTLATSFAAFCWVLCQHSPLLTPGHRSLFQQYVNFEDPVYIAAGSAADNVWSLRIFFRITLLAFPYHVHGTMRHFSKSRATLGPNDNSLLSKVAAWDPSGLSFVPWASNHSLGGEHGYFASFAKVGWFRGAEPA